MKKKILLLIIILFSLTGCTINYDMKVNSDLSVDEQIYVYEMKSGIVGFDSYDKYLNSYIQEYNFKLNEFEYKYSKSITNDRVGLNLKKSYHNIDDYTYSVSGLYQYFDSIESVSNGNLVTLRYNNLHFLYDQNPNQESADQIYFTLKLPFKVVSILNMSYEYSNDLSICSSIIDKDVKGGITYEVTFNKSTYSSSNDKPEIKTGNDNGDTKKDTNNTNKDTTDNNTSDNSTSNDVDNNSNIDNNDDNKKIDYKLVLMISGLVILVGFMAFLVLLFKYKKTNSV